MIRSLQKVILFISPILKFQIEGKSMEPTYKFGDVVLANRLSYLFKKPKIGEVVALKDPKSKKYIIKRIQKIQNGKYFVVGDNKKESTDSRKFGWVLKKQIIGKVCQLN